MDPRMEMAAALAAQQQLMQQAAPGQPMFPTHHPQQGLLAAPQIEPIVSGNLPPGFDSSTCRSVYVGNIHVQVSELLLHEVFQSIGPVEGCRLIRKEKSSFGFVEYYDRRCAALAIVTLNGRQLFGQPIKVNWAYASTQKEDTSGHFNIFVWHLSSEVTDAVLYAFFSAYSTCSDARVMRHQRNGRSRGLGFVSFRNQQDAQTAINELNGKRLGNHQIRCAWATKGATAGEEKQSTDSKGMVELINRPSGSVFNEARAGLRIGSKTILDPVQFGEFFPEYSSGFMEPALHSSVATRESSYADHSSRLETFMSEALYTNNLTQKQTGSLSAAGMPSSQGKMDMNSLWLPAAETDIPITDWIDAVMDGPITASLGPMAPLLQQVHSLSAMAPEHIHGGSEDDVKRLKEHLEVLCRDLLEPQETSSTPMWWRKEVRELLYDTKDRLDRVIIFQASDFSELIADVEDACKRRKRLQLAPNKTTKPDLGEAVLSYFTTQRTSVELSKPISIQAHPAGLGVVGVEDPMNKLVKQLAFDDDKQKRLKVIPIVGFPGVGKTTVAGILYYDYRGKFQCSAFVRVSRTPDTRSLLISILSQIKAPWLCGFPDVHDLIDGIRKHLKGKRYFIIMDDLWTATIWDIISRAFPDADCGSRIITTTQIDDVALACCRYYLDYIEISPLNDDQSKELFFKKVFGSEDRCPPDFKKVSYKIINKCAGLPLAIVSITGLLASESFIIVEKWEHIQDSLPCMRTNPTSEGVKGLSSDAAIGTGGRMLARGPKIEK